MGKIVEVVLYLFAGVVFGSIVVLPLRLHEVADAINNQTIVLACIESGVGAEDLCQKALRQVANG